MTVLGDTGVLVFPPYRDVGSGRLKLSFREHNAQLLFYLTYFQRVRVVPLNFQMPLFGFSTSSALEQMLVHQGVLSPVLFRGVRQDGPFGAQFIERWALQASRGANGTDEGPWAVATPPELGAGFAGDETNALSVHIRKLLPSPQPHVSVNEVLDFVSRHQRELDDLRRCIDRLYFSVCRGSADDARRILELELDEGIGLIREGFRKRKIPFITPDIEISLQVPQEWIGIASECLAQLAGLPPMVGGVVGSAVAMSLRKNSLAKAGNAQPRDFQYIASGFREQLLELESAPLRCPLNLDIAMSHCLFDTHYPEEPAARNPRSTGRIAISHNVLIQRPARLAKSR